MKTHKIKNIDPLPKPPEKRTWIPSQWTFESSAVAGRFDAHVREQLPWYDHLLRCIEHFGAHYIPRGGVVYDVGASTGNVGRALKPYLVDRACRMTSIEPSPAMELQAQLAGQPPGKWAVADALTFDFEPFDFCVCNLVLMFLPVADRGHFIRKLCDLVLPGGAIILVDKIVSPPGYLGQVLRRMAIKGKLEAGATAEEILAKELSLGGVQRPIDPRIIPGDATRFFQFGEFVGWVWERGERGPA